MACIGITIGLSLPNPVTKHRPVCSLSSKSSGGLISTTRSIGNRRFHRRGSQRLNCSSSRIMASTTEIEKLGIKVVTKPSETKLSELGVRSWPKWGCPPSKFPWTYSSRETCYLLEGKVKVYPEGSDEAVEIAAGDLVVFPKGMSCTWDVSEAVDKHYKFD